MTEILNHEFDGSYSMTFKCGTPADEAVYSAGHEPNGYFWEGVAQLLISTEAQVVSGKVEYDSEGSMFCALSDDKAALDALSALLAPVISDSKQMAIVIARAAELEFEFDD